MRRLMTIDCAGESLGATLDFAEGTTGLLIVTGGTQTRIGAHRGMMRLARAVAAAGFPAFRFDRRGVGDSGGEDPGFADSGLDIAAAAAAFRSACPQLTRIVGFGLCDGASALALHHVAAGVDRLILANPWTVEPQAGLPPPAAIRRRYAERLFSPAAWRRLLTGAMDYRAALRGIASILRRREPVALASAMGCALAESRVPIEIVLATGDATAIAFAADWAGPAFAAAHGAGAKMTRVDTRSHSFASDDEPEQLSAIVLANLKWSDACRSKRRLRE